MIKRPRNRQPRGHHNGQNPNDNNSRQPHNQHSSPNTPHRGRGRGRGRGGSFQPRHHSRARPDLLPLPTTREVVPGAAVSIVLKEDQRTGIEVQGTVQDLLTRGDHPRGIKVRLRDGRIGRVQRMGSDGPEGLGSQSAADIRGGNDDGYEGSDRETDEDTFYAGAGQDDSEVSVCPVCGTFKGDETAIAHHVNTHFD